MLEVLPISPTECLIPLLRLFLEPLRFLLELGVLTLVELVVLPSTGYPANGGGIGLKLTSHDEAMSVEAADKRMPVLKLSAELFSPIGSGVVVIVDVE